jgi:hypothetical protein
MDKVYSEELNKPVFTLTIEPAPLNCNWSYELNPQLPLGCSTPGNIFYNELNTGNGFAAPPNYCDDEPFKSWWFCNLPVSHLT